MTNRDNIIFYTITAVVFIGIVVCSLLFHNSDQPITTGGSTNGEKQSMVEILAPYAPIINAVAVLISTGFVIWVACRKTRRDRIDKLKEEMLILLSQGCEFKIKTVTDAEKFFLSLNRKFQGRKYKGLHWCAFNELGYETSNYAYLAVMEDKLTK